MLKRIFVLEKAWVAKIKVEPRNGHWNTRRFLLFRPQWEWTEKIAAILVFQTCLKQWDSSFRGLESSRSCFWALQFRGWSIVASRFHRVSYQLSCTERALNDSGRFRVVNELPLAVEIICTIDRNCNSFFDRIFVCFSSGDLNWSRTSKCGQFGYFVFLLMELLT